MRNSFHTHENDYYAKFHMTIEKKNKQMKAIWNNTVIAESNETIIIEFNHYFPADSVNMEYLKKSSFQTTCPWKGVASYYDIVVDGRENHEAAWYYPEPKLKAHRIKGYIAFWKGVEIIE